MPREPRALRMAAGVLRQGSSLRRWVQCMRPLRRAVVGSYGNMISWHTATQCAVPPQLINPEGIFCRSRAIGLLNKVYVVQAVVARQEGRFVPGLRVTINGEAPAFNWDGYRVSLNLAKADALRWLCASTPLGMDLLVEVAAAEPESEQAA